MLNRLGIRLHPSAVTEAWYAANCPPKFRPNLSRRDRFRWMVSRWLRGIR